MKTTPTAAALALLLAITAGHAQAALTVEGWAASTYGNVYLLQSRSASEVDLYDGGCGATWCAAGAIQGGVDGLGAMAYHSGGYNAPPGSVSTSVTLRGRMMLVAQAPGAPAFADATLNLHLGGGTAASHGGGNSGGNFAVTAAVEGLPTGGTTFYRQSFASGTTLPPIVSQGMQRVGSDGLAASFLHLAVGLPFDLVLTLQAQAGSTGEAMMNIDFRHALSLATAGPVFTLPAGLTLESADWSVQDNQWCPGGCAPVPEPATWLLLPLGLAFIARHRRSFMEVSSC